LALTAVSETWLQCCAAAAAAAGEHVHFSGAEGFRVGGGARSSKELKNKGHSKFGAK
jgi:hypothetical protein